jgi:hypothetical protein
MNLSEFINQYSGLDSRLRSSVRSTLFEECRSLAKDFKRRSPIDSGLFASNWVVSRIGRGTGSFAGYSIINPTPYAIWLDEGGQPGGIPWFFPRKDSDGSAANISPSGKLIYKDGRVWAGGKSPSGFVIGGITDKILLNNPKRIDRIANSIADIIIKQL